MIKEKLIKEKNDAAAGNASIKDLLNNDLKSMVDGITKTNESIDEKDYKALLKK